MYTELGDGGVRVKKELADTIVTVDHFQRVVTSIH
jgi:hypothetical protein